MNKQQYHKWFREVAEQEYFCIPFFDISPALPCCCVNHPQTGTLNPDGVNKLFFEQMKLKTEEVYRRSKPF